MLCTTFAVAILGTGEEMQPGRISGGKVDGRKVMFADRINGWSLNTVGIEDEGTGDTPFQNLGVILRDGFCTDELI